MTLTVRGMKLSFTVLQGRKLYMPVEGKCLASMVDHIANNGIEPGPDFAALLGKTDRPHLGWRVARPESQYHGNWYIRYQGEASSHVE